MTFKKTAFSLLLSGSLLCMGAAYADETQPANPVTAPATTAEAAAPSTATPASSSATPTAAGQVAAGVPQESSATPAGEPGELIHQDWPFEGAFGTYDRAALQRGFQVYKQVCSACHSMNLLSYRNLQDIGYTEGQVKAIAAGYTVPDINDDGQPVDRPAKPSDRFRPPFPNKKASMASNNGAYPPDMSLLAKAREGGADYIYGILTGFAQPPSGVTLQPGQYWNKAMPGHIMAMPPPLTDGQVTYEGGGVPQTVDQYARDVAQFLTWAAEPHMEERKKTGTKVFLFLLAFAFVCYGVKKRVWRDVH